MRFRLLGSAVFAATILVSGVRPALVHLAIDWNDIRQTIDGFGAASNETSFVVPLSDATMDFFYTPTGIGLSLLRIRLYPTVADCELDSGPGACLNAGGAGLLRTDLAIARGAVARGARVWCSQWSPPAAMKSNGEFLKGGAMIATPANFTALATRFATFAAFMATQGIAIYAISPQNEPDMSTWYPSATWTAREIHDFVPYLRSALDSAALREVRILIAEESHWQPGPFQITWFPYVARAMRDSAVAARVDIIGAHNYDQRNPLQPPRLPNLQRQRVWETEVSSFDRYDGAMANALRLAERIHHFVATAHANAFHYWYLTAGPRQADNEALTDQLGHAARRAYVMGHWSRFVRPGWHVVRASSTARTLVTAFQDSSRTGTAIVVVNLGDRGIETRVDVPVADGAQLVPWVTDSRRQLVPLPPVVAHAGAVLLTLPAESVVTLASEGPNRL
jgi:glucuronoarabinoxylan endo-1,4-beta-xylanase